MDAEGFLYEVWSGTNDSQANEIADFAVSWEQTEYLVSGLKAYVDTSISG